MKMSREELKRLFLTFPTEDRATVKTIVVEMDKYEGRKGQGTVEITRDGPDGFSQFKTHQEYPYTYATSRKEFASGEYELIVK
jgi:hypothetical protein